MKTLRLLVLMFGAGCSSADLGDASGALLMYSDGRTIWNRDHEPMPHATAADADQSLGGSSSATQSVVFTQFADEVLL
jgi:hypothetical protein